MTDQNGTTHAYGFDTLGRPITDTVTVLGSGVDGSVRLHTTNYNSQGDVYQMSAYADTGGLTLVNQVQDAYNGLGQVTGEYQADSGAVVTTGPAPTPQRQYAYSDPTSGSLMTAMTYPNGRILHYGYTDNALDAAIGRVDYLADDNGSGFATWRCVLFTTSREALSGAARFHSFLTNQSCCIPSSIC